MTTFLIPHVISSVCFGCFDTSLKYQNKPENFLGGFAKKQTKKQPKQIEFRFVSVWTEKKINSFEDPLREKFLWRFFQLVLVCFKNILFVSVVSIPVQNTETNLNKTKKCFLVLRNKPKNIWNRLSFGLFRSNWKKNFDCFEVTLHPDTVQINKKCSLEHPPKTKKMFQFRKMESIRYHLK